MLKLMNEIILPFYKLERNHPLPFKKRRFETDAEHSWSIATIACSLAPNIDNSLDLGKIAQYALVHDLMEVYSGDTNVFATNNELATKDRREADAINKIGEEFHKFPWLIDTINEYEEQKTKEAKFVKSIDKYVALLLDHLDNGNYFKDSKITKESFQKKIAAHRQKAKTHPGVFIYYEEILNIILEAPGFFHQQK